MDRSRQSDDRNQPSSSQRGNFDPLRIESDRREFARKKRDEILTLQYNIEEAERNSNEKSKDYNWKIWMSMQDREEFNGYITDKTKNWKNKETQKLIDVYEKYEKRVKKGKISEELMKEKLEALKVKYQKKEMQRIADDLKKYIYK
jgi:hypothetical protein